VRILCGGAQCGEYLGDVGPSVVGMRGGVLVWRIAPGWRWVFPTRGEPLRSGILERVDEERRAERQLMHEVFGGRPDVRSALAKGSGVGVAREANLPIVVRCPKCHRLRYVPADVATVTVLQPARRLVQIVRS